MQVGIDFGWLLDRVFVDLGPKLGGQVVAKLAPKSEEMGYQDDVKKSFKKSRDARVRKWYATGPGSCHLIVS